VGSDVIYDVLAGLILLLVLGAILQSDRRRSRLLLLLALSVFTIGLLAWLAKLGRR
jgi:aminopeptidase-like protein